MHTASRKLPALMEGLRPLIEKMAAHPHPRFPETRYSSLPREREPTFFLQAQLEYHLLHGVFIFSYSEQPFLNQHVPHVYHFMSFIHPTSVPAQ